MLLLCFAMFCNALLCFCTALLPHESACAVCSVHIVKWQTRSLSHSPYVYVCSAAAQRRPVVPSENFVMILGPSLSRAVGDCWPDARATDPGGGDLDQPDRDDGHAVGHADRVDALNHHTIIMQQTILQRGLQFVGVEYIELCVCVSPSLLRATSMLAYRNPKP